MKASNQRGSRSPDRSSVPMNKLQTHVSSAWTRSVNTSLAPYMVIIFVELESPMRVAFEVKSIGRV